MDKKVFSGYCSTNGLAQITPAQARALTHVNIAFAEVHDNVVTLNNRERIAFEVKRLRAFNPELKVLISIAGGAQDQFTEMGKATGTAESREKLVAEYVRIVKELDLDGVDSDWEWPCRSGDMKERDNFSDFIDKLRKALDAYGAKRGKPCLLTMAVGYTPLVKECFDLPFISQRMDIINLMTYDFRWGDPLTGHMCNPCSPSEEDPISAEWEACYFHEQGVPFEKMTLGVAFYSHKYIGVRNENNGMGQPYEGDSYLYGPGYDAISLLHEKSGEYQKFTDEKAKASWLFNGETLFTYDDVASTQAKADIMRRYGLAGMMYWVHQSDCTGVLFDCMKENLNA